MKNNRYSLDSHINFTSQGSLKNNPNKSSSVRSSSLTNNHKFQLPNTSVSLPSNCQKNSKTKFTKGSLQNAYGKRLQRDSPSTVSGTSSINSLFLMNRVRSFTWKLRRRLIQTSIETDSIPPEVLYPTKLGVSLDNFVILHSTRSGSCDASALSMKHSNSFMKNKNKQRNSSVYPHESKQQFRHSIDSSIPKKDIVCSHDDFKSIVHSVKEKRNNSKASFKRENYKNSKRGNGFNLSIVNSKLCCNEEFIPMKIRNETSYQSNFPNSFFKFNMPLKSHSPNIPKRSLSDSSLSDIRKVAFDIGETCLDSRTDEKTSLLVESGRLDEIVETDKEMFDKNQSQESIYNFTLPNIQILGDAIQQHLKVLMSIQFGEVEKSAGLSVFELSTNNGFLDRVFNTLKLSRLNCCC